MQFENTQNYPKIDLFLGLKRLVENPKARLYSNGLDDYNGGAKSQLIYVWDG